MPDSSDDKPGPDSTLPPLCHYNSSVSVLLVSLRWRIRCTTTLQSSIFLISWGRTLAAPEAFALCSAILSTASRTYSPRCRA